MIHWYVYTYVFYHVHVSNQICTSHTCIFYIDSIWLYSYCSYDPQIHPENCCGFFLNSARRAQHASVIWQGNLTTALSCSGKKGCSSCHLRSGTSQIEEMSCKDWPIRRDPWYVDICNILEYPCNLFRKICFRIVAVDSCEAIHQQARPGCLEKEVRPAENEQQTISEKGRGGSVMNYQWNLFPALFAEKSIVSTVSFIIFIGINLKVVILSLCSPVSRDYLGKKLTLTSWCRLMLLKFELIPMLSYPLFGSARFIQIFYTPCKQRYPRVVSGGQHTSPRVPGIPSAWSGAFSTDALEGGRRLGPRNSRIERIPQTKTINNKNSW